MNTYKHLLVIVLLCMIVPTLEAAPTLTFDYGADDKPIPGVRVTQTESDGTVTIYASDANGQITLPTTANTYTLAASLAETGTDPISVQDALYILQHIVELRTLETDQIKAADINGDGNITIQDALKVLQHNVELITLEPSLSFYEANTGNALSTITFNPGDTPSITVIRQGDANLTFEPDSITDHAPILTGPTTLTIDENTTAVSTLLGIDADGDIITYSITGGADASSFSISATGVLTFNTAPNYETDQTSYSVTVTVTDGTNSVTQDITVTVTDVNENSLPVITNKPESLSIEENSIIVYDYDASDPEGDTIYFLTSGTDSSLFEISSSGVLSFINAPDYENPEDSDKDNKYEVEVSVTDVNPESSNYSAKLDLVASNSSSDSSVSITNIDEDLINLILSTIDGTASAAPTINIDLQIDELTYASSVSILTWKVGGVQTWSSATKVDSLNWNLSLALDTTAASGTYAVRSVEINKTDGTQISFVQSALDDKGFTTSSEIYNAQSDSNAPTLTSVNSITVENNDGDPNTNIILTIKVGVNDVEGGLQKAFSYVGGPGGESTGDWGSLNSGKDEVTFTFSLDPRTGSGTYKINDIRLYDIAGNSDLINTTEIASLGFQNNFEINNSISDDTAPNIIALAFTPSVDASDNDRKQITINLTTDDNQVSDIRDIYIRLKSPTNAIIGKYIMDIGRPFTTTVNGNNYSHTISLPLEYPAGEYTVWYINVNDEALNNRRYEASDLTALGFATSLTFD